MLKSTSTKSKPRPWIPPGKGVTQYKKPGMKNKKYVPISPKVPHKKIDKNINLERLIEVSVEEAREDDADLISVSSHSSCEVQDEMDIDVHEIFALQEMKLIQMHFASLKASHLLAFRLIDSQNIEDSNIKGLFVEVADCMKKFASLSDDLEYALTCLKNSLNESEKKAEYSTVYQNKKKLLSRFLDTYDKVVLIFQAVLEKQNFKELSDSYDSLSKQLKISEGKCISQEAVITDLQRRLSIHQSNVSTMESYKTNFESAKADLEKQLLSKESCINYLKNELVNAAQKPVTSDREDFLELIESIKHKAHVEKSKLKEALKFIRNEFKLVQQKCEKLSTEASEKEKMMFDLAAQRDQLKVQLTIVNNSIIEQKNQMEGLKIKNQKLQNEVAENETCYKNETTQLKHAVKEKSSELDNLLKEKTTLEKTIQELETELEKSNKQLKSLKEESNVSKLSDLHMSKETDVMYEEIHRLISLLQSTKKVIESLQNSSHVPSVSGDHVANVEEFNNIQHEALAVVKETDKHVLELRDMFIAYLQNHQEVPGQKDHTKKNDWEKQLKKMENLCTSTMKENEALKQELEAMKKSSVSTSTVQKTENCFTDNKASDNSTRKLQLELFEKSNEISSLKCKFKQKERNLETELKITKDKLRTMEVHSSKILTLEEELRNTKLELSTLQKNKGEENENLLQRMKELQDSLDVKMADYESLKRYVDLVKSSYYNVFES